MPAMHAYLDDFGKITIWMNKNFYGGRSDYFSLVEGSSSQDLVVVNAEEHDTKMKYVLTCPADGTFGKDYKIRESHGLIVPLQIRNIVSTDEFNRMFYYGGDDLGSIYHPTHTDFALWAPTAVSVTLHIHMNKKVDSDAWDDEKSKREAEIQKQEEAVKAREDAITEKEKEIQEMKEKIEAFPGELETAKEEAAKEAKAKAERSFAYEKRAIESDKKHAEEMAAAEIANLKSQVESLKQANNELTNKLDDAYKKMNEVATATVQAGATVKVVSSDK